MDDDPHDSRDSSGRVFDLNEIRTSSHYARCYSGDDHLFEFDLGRFWVSSLAGRQTRRAVSDLGDLPGGPWRHSPVCACPACASRAPDQP
jgi:hypothetical protein